MCPTLLSASGKVELECEVGGLLGRERLDDLPGACEGLQRRAILLLRRADAPDGVECDGKVALECEVGGLLGHEGRADLLDAREGLQRGPYSPRDSRMRPTFSSAEAR